MRCRSHHALEGNIKSSTTKKISRKGIGSFKKGEKFQITPEMNRKNIEIDHVKSISSFDVSESTELTKVFNWLNKQF